MAGKQRACQLRKSSTDAERLLWNTRRAGRVGGFKFRRQHPVGSYFVDFICIERELVIEVDGDHHADQAAYDEEGDRWLEGQPPHPALQQPGGADSPAER